MLVKLHFAVCYKHDLSAQVATPLRSLGSAKKCGNAPFLCVHPVVDSSRNVTGAMKDERERYGDSTSGARDCNGRLPFAG